MRVTRILGSCGLREWPSCISETDKEFYLNRGTQIHKVCELFDRGSLDESSVDDRIMGFLEAWKLFRRQVGGKILAIEKEVKHKTLGYQGRLDRLLGACAVCKFPSVLDIKSNQADVFTRLQLSGYRMALARNKQIKRMAVSLFDTGKFKVSLYDDDAKDDATWIHCVALASWLQRHNMEKR